MAGRVLASYRHYTAAGLTAPALTGRWYSPLSSWNKPIPDNPPIHAQSASMISAGTSATSSFSQYNAPLTWCMGPTDSGVPSLWTGYASYGTTDVWINNPNVSCHSGDALVPFPPNMAVEGPGAPEPVAVVMTDTGIEWDFYKLTAPGVATVNSNPALNCAANNNWQCVIAANPGGGWTGLADAASGGTFYRASKTPAGAGTIRYRDAKRTDAVGYDHALALAYPLCRAATDVVPFVYPAGATDGDRGVASFGFSGLAESACIPQGARIQLDPSINVDTNVNFTNYDQRQIAKTLQRYGAIVVDTGGAMVTEQSSSVTKNENGTYNFPWNVSPFPVTKLPAAIAPSLRVIDWTQWT